LSLLGSLCAACLALLADHLLQGLREALPLLLLMAAGTCQLLFQVIVEARRFSGGIYHVHLKLVHALRQAGELPNDVRQELRHF
jgi:hypothetical protein